MDMDPAVKVAALLDLIGGAPDVYAMHWTDDTGQGQWSPAYRPLSEATAMAHLRGEIEVGTYPLIPAPDGSLPLCRWICADFDGKRPGSDWKRDVRRALEFLMEHEGCPAFVNLSRSGQGAHIRMLFAEPVPAWMARRWLTAWLVEAQVMRDPDDDSGDDYDLGFPSFDRLIPPQDRLYDAQQEGQPRRPGNLAGAPLNLRRTKYDGGSLPLNTGQAAMGNFEPDGRHWHHVIDALEQREWGPRELAAAMRDAPGSPDPTPPRPTRKSLPVLPGTESELALTTSFCEFFRYMRNESGYPYPMWMALATQLHRFGEEGRQAFHAISSNDPRYRAHKTDRKWEQTAEMSPVRCDTLDAMGWRCPLLGTRSCGSRTPALFARHTHAELL
jgi:hypothetical protein